MTSIVVWNKSFPGFEPSHFASHPFTGSLGCWHVTSCAAPVLLPGENGWLFASARLDNRADVAARLEFSSDQARVLTDSELLSAAYGAWGAQCGEHMLGAWCFVALDARTGTITLGRDALGLAPLYYAAKRNRLTFASRLPDLLWLEGGGRRLNPMALAQLGYGHKRDTSTFFAGLSKAPAAQVLSVGADGSVLRRVRYWDPGAVPKLRYPRDEDYVEAFAGLYDEVVNNALTPGAKVGIALSSGLDSSSIAALAAPRMAASGYRLQAYSWAPGRRINTVPPRGRFWDERPQVAQLAARIGNIDVTTVEGNSGGLLATIRQMLKTVEEPSNALAGWHWYHRVWSRAAADGIGVLLTGDFGNYTVSLDRRNHAVPGWRDRYHAFRHRLRNRHLGRHTHARMLVRPDFVERMLADCPPQDPALTARWRKASHPLRSFYNILQSGGASLQCELGEAMQLEMRMPAIDRRMVDFCCGVPSEQHARHGQTKLLMRRAFVGRLPDTLLWNRQRGLSGGDVVQALAAEKEEVFALLDAAARCPLTREALDLPWLQARAARLGLDGSQSLDVMDAGLLMRGLTYMMFLQGFDDVAAK
ncbi:asparagine synthase-related protein [Novosphingobium sp. TH158]|uniref:asparagine synthase-related protein n=1 Tax=Novosphingobium sp. TH158 TaxID=2067455 RepID=UPI000C7999D0|nr:asparagine synthase-related protein [Novosphingobium sp. TH158]PLK26695.1 hypothetical protein C0V78_07200 [Novosphingobium sp. TH158]